ncbi:MAG: hypothetical protein OHK0045_04960 [Raineya sp.]
MKKPSFLLFLAFLAMANQCKKSSDLDPIFDKVWLRSSEEEKTDGIEVYRTNNYNFPSTRGPRQGYKFSKSGEFTMIIAPADAPMELKGSWKSEGKKKISINLEKNDFVQKSQFIYEVVEAKTDVLKIKSVQ